MELQEIDPEIVLCWRFFDQHIVGRVRIEHRRIWGCTSVKSDSDVYGGYSVPDDIHTTARSDHNGDSSVRTK
jgi:hypothetical protein